MFEEIKIKSNIVAFNLILLKVLNLDDHDL